MTDSLERRRKEQPCSVICAGGYVLRQREWNARGEECLGETCPHPTTCTTRHRDLAGAKSEGTAYGPVEKIAIELIRRVVHEEMDKRDRQM